jgi:hypothetical protein
MGEFEEIDREPPMGMFLFAESFLDAARHLRRAFDNRELSLRFDAPIYFLYSHALELTMKALLRAKGVSARRLASREFGHQLQVLWRECFKQGLSTSPNHDTFISGVIEILDPLATKYEFRYLKVGLKRIPELDDVELAVGLLRTAVKPLL